MKLTRIHLLIIFLALGAALVLSRDQVQINIDPPSPLAFPVSPASNEPPLQDALPIVENFSQPGNSYEFALPTHTYQTFNNCGPASLSMILAFYDINKSQKELGLLMRPYQNGAGNNDDKSLFSEEFVRWAKNFGLPGLVRPDGDLNKIKALVANDLPVVVRTWLRVGEDVGHYRIIHGFDENRKVIIQTDSYFGPKKEVSYSDFEAMWQPFNYEYFVIYEDSSSSLVKTILGEDFDAKVAWKNAEERALAEIAANQPSVYPTFNLSVALYHQSRFVEAVNEFEKVENQLPARMLWYQLEPILTYAELGNAEKVFSMTNKILNSGNRAFSELYQIRGEIYAQTGAYDEAQREFELALHYNENYESAKNSLEKLKSI